MQTNGYRNSDEFRQAVAALQQRYIPQAIDNQHGENSAGQYPTEILNIAGSGPFGSKHQKWEKPCQHGSHYAHGNRYDLLLQCHPSALPLPLSIGLCNTVNAIRMQIMVGIRKLSAPNNSRHPTLAASPTHSLI